MSERVDVPRELLERCLDAVHYTETRVGRYAWLETLRQELLAALSVGDPKGADHE